MQMLDTIASLVGLRILSVSYTAEVCDAMTLLQTA
jgi:hypothetical protein